MLKAKDLGGNRHPGAAPLYDTAGDVLEDNQNQYLYDAEGRICAVKNLLVGAMTEYLYDPEGNRVAKGTIANWSAGCDTTQNGFTMTASYILGPGNQQLTELPWASNSGPVLSNPPPAGWHTNAFAAGQLMATFSTNPDPDTSQTMPAILNYYLTDWLGTRRVMTDSVANVQETCDSLPYGDGETCIPAPTEHLFTGKERDSESGNDYFGARYYASSMGRFMSPDPSQLYYADQTNPQSLNLYAYVRNNPLVNIDPNGLDCITDNGDGSYTANSGDCENGSQGGDPNKEYYVDCDGCTSGGVSNVSLPDNPGGINFSTSNGSFYADQGGSLFSIDATGYGVGFTSDTLETPWENGQLVTGATQLTGGAAAPNSPAPNNPSNKVTQDDHYISVLDPQYKSKKCKEANVLFWVGGVGGSALTTGAAAAAIFLGPEEFVGAEAGIEGTMSLMHIAPIGVPGFGMLVYGGVGIYQNCF